MYGGEKLDQNRQHIAPESLMEQETIRAAMELARPSITVIGAGGAGSNIVSWIKERGISGGKLVAVNTDAAHLSITKADRRILIGAKLCMGRGCGGYPDKGKQATYESLHEVEREVDGSNIIFLCAGLGGGTGTGAIQILAEELKKLTGALVVGVVTLPFAVERYRFDLAKEALEKLRGSCDTVVAIDNNRLTKVAGNLPLQEALGVANQLVGEFIRGITETITTASLINIDFADLTAIMENKGLAAIGVGYRDGVDRIEKAVRVALDAQLLDIKDMSCAHGALVHVSGGNDITLEEVTRAGELVTRSLPHNVRIVWGAKIDKNMNGHARVMVVLTGIESTLGEEPKQVVAPPMLEKPKKKGLFSFLH